MDDIASDAARELSKLGAAKGGQARANALSPEQRSAIARQAVAARWAKAEKLKSEDGTREQLDPLATLTAPVAALRDEQDRRSMGTSVFEPTRRSVL